MFQLTSSNLPLESIVASPAPIFTIWRQESRGMGPILQVNCYGNWWENPGWQVETLPLGAPSGIGKYCQIALDSDITVTAIPSWGQVDNAIAARPDTFWQSDSLNLYQQNLPTPTIAAVTIDTTAPVAISANYIVQVPTGFTATSVSSLGLTFTNGGGVGNFSQNGNTVTIYGSAAYSLSFGQDLLITGNLELASPQILSSVVSFYLGDVIYLDRIEWAGHNFSPAKTADSPQLWEFTWDGSGHIANLFLDSACIPYFPALQTIQIAQSSGVINFNR
jgi:hypothetical protein